MSASNTLTARSLETREWTEIRCRECNAFFLKAERNALKPSKVLEIKCYKCNAMNYCAGSPE